MTQFGRTLAELNIETLGANSSQARGGVERVNRTLQDRSDFISTYQKISGVWLPKQNVSDTRVRFGGHMLIS